MKKFVSFLSVSAAIVVVSLPVSPAQAQATRTWVAGLGNDADPCNRSNPCKTFAGAISKTAAFGEINCVDPGAYGTVTITKSIAIRCNYTEAGVLAQGSDGIVVKVGPTDTVYLEGLDILGITADIAGPPLNGINFIQAGTLHVKNSVIRGFANKTSGTGNGIKFAPTGMAKLFVSDTHISENGIDLGSAGILIQPAASTAVNASINRVLVQNNVNGVFVNNLFSTPMNANVRDSVVAANSNTGIFVSASGTSTTILVDTASVLFNVNIGVAAAGKNATVLIGNSTVADNVTGVQASSGGIIQSFKENHIGGNLTDGTPIPAFPGPGGPLQ
jgi:hypothetical protein